MGGSNLELKNSELASITLTRNPTQKLSEKSRYFSFSTTINALYYFTPIPLSLPPLITLAFTGDLNKNQQHRIIVYGEFDLSRSRYGSRWLAVHVCEV